MLTRQELYLFDTMGYLRLEQLLDKEEIASLRDALENVPTIPSPFTNTVRYERLVEHDPVFAALAVDRRLAACALDVINQPMRLIESYSTRRTGPSVLYLHNGQSEEFDEEGISATRNMGISHTYHDGHIYCMYVKAICYLTDITSELDGPFCYLQGSHKANFSLLKPMAGPGYRPLVDRGFPSLAWVPVRAGDVILLNEALMHGTLRKESVRERTLLAFSYAPSFVSDYRELSRDPGDLVTMGHYETVEESLCVEAGFSV